jgi:hypothetical protein
MPEYMLLIYQPVGLIPSPEQIAAAAPKWQAIAQDLGEKGMLKFANGLAGVDVATTVRVRDGETQMTDGPFAETKELLAGFWLWQVKSKEEAIEWVKRCPNPHNEDCEVEIRQVFESEDFGAELTPELREQEERLRATIAEKR